MFFDKEEIKRRCYYGMIFFSIVIVFMSYLTLTNIKSEVYIERNVATEARLDNLKKEVELLREGSCKDFLNEYITYIDKGYFEGVVKLKDIYNYYWNTPSVNYYEMGINNCAIDRETLQNTQIPTKYVTNMVYPDYLLDEYIYQYEFRIKDPVRLIMEPNTFNLTLNNMRNNQINILEDYINIYKGKVSEE